MGSRDWLNHAGIGFLVMPSKGVTGRPRDAPVMRISHEIDQLLRQVRDLVLAGENLERSGASEAELEENRAETRSCTSRSGAR